MVAWRVEGVYREFILQVERSREDLERYEAAGRAAASLEALLPMLPPSERGVVAEALARAKSYALEGDAAGALEGVETACRRAAAVVASRIASTRLEAGRCPELQAAKLLRAVVEASGPLSPVISSLLASGASAAEDVFSNAEMLASRWQLVSKLLVDFYNASKRLERRGYGSWSDHTIVLSKLARGVSVNDAVSKLEEAVKSFTELARLADELAGGAAEAAEALTRCGEESGARQPPVCRWLTQIVDELMDAGEALKTLPLVEGRDELMGVVERVRRAYEKLAASRRMAEKLLARLSGRHHAAKPLVEIVEALLEARERLGFTDLEEELMIALGEQDRLDLLELAERNREYLEAALNLCKHGMAVCEVKIY